MASALAAGEHYDAALLDSIHTAEHVWAEFELARQLVCPGGLILIHDVRYAHGTVEEALQRIEASGYGVVRLWTAEGGVCEDDRLGLAVIENRCRSVG
jgi:cephalosporin hydroxylase